MSEPTAPAPETPARPPSPPGRLWAIGVLVLSALVSMSMNTWHAFAATTLPVPLALMYGVAPVALAAMQSHAVALRALRKEKVGPFRRFLTFGLVLGGLGLSFLGIYDLLRHAVPDPLPGVPLHEPAVFFSVVLDVMALAALHELLRESPSFVSAVQAAETVFLKNTSAVPEPAAVSFSNDAVEPERVTETPAISSPMGEEDRESIKVIPAVPDPFAGVPPQVTKPIQFESPNVETGDPEPAFSDQVQPDRAAELDAPYRPVAVAHFLSDVLQGDLPPVRTIKDEMSVGTDRARRLQAYLGQLVEVTR